jgi:nucleotidyltransferase substrate binding protein (TIGR01987 family)
MTLDISSFRDAVGALDKSFGYLHSDLAKDLGLREQFRAAAIQAFEFTYELAFKMLKRRLEQISASPASLRGESYMFLVRTAAESGLIPDVARFRHYRNMRNITSHTYKAEKAEEVIGVLPEFLADMRYLLNALSVQNEP